MKQIGEYMVLRELGRGGMGAVYEAQERLSRRAVALKVMHGNIAASARGRALFVAEMGILAGVDHPNVVRLLACLEHQDQLVMVLELLRGETLEQTLKRQRRLAWTDAVVITGHILAGLAAAHGQQPPVVHRDLKPANVMITEEGIAKVMDFGIAKVLQGETSATADVGTLQYMSPEQIDGGAIDARADLYAAGLVLYEMLAGVPPFVSTSTRALLQAQCTAPVPPLPPEVANAVPRDLVHIMLLLLAKSPADRPGSADAALRMLESLGGTEVLSFRPTMTASPASEAASFPGASAWQASQPGSAPGGPTDGPTGGPTDGPTGGPIGGAPAGSFPGGSQWQDTRGPAAPTGGMPAGSFPGGSQWAASQPGTHGGYATGAGPAALGSAYPHASDSGAGQPALGPSPAPVPQSGGWTANGPAAAPSLAHGRRVAPTKPRRLWPWIVGGVLLLFIAVSVSVMSQFVTMYEEATNKVEEAKASAEYTVPAHLAPPPSEASPKAAPKAKAKAKAKPEREAKPDEPAPKPETELGTLPDRGAELRLVDPPSQAASDALGPVTVFDVAERANEFAQECGGSSLAFRRRYNSFVVGAAPPTRIDDDAVEDIVLVMRGLKGEKDGLLALSGQTFDPIWHAKDLPGGVVARSGQLLLYATKRELRGFDIRSGNQRWTAALSDRVAQVGLGADAKDLFVVTVDRKLHRVNPQDGTVGDAPKSVPVRDLGPIPGDASQLVLSGSRQGLKPDPPRISDLTRGIVRCAHPGMASSSSQTCVGGEIYGIYEAFPGTPDPFAVAFRNGTELWRTQLYDGLEKTATTLGNFVAIGGPFVAVIKSNRLAVVSRSDGETRWPAPVDLGDQFVLGLLVSAERVYVVSRCPMVLDADDATLLNPP